MTQSDLTKNIYTRLGELLYRCQRIEWNMKRFLEKICIKQEFESIEAARKASYFEEKWQKNLDTMGGVRSKYLDLLFGDLKEASFTDGKIGMQLNFQLDKKFYPERQKCFDELVDVRNRLAHHLGLEFDLADTNACKTVTKVLDDAETKITLAEKVLKGDIDMVCQLARKSVDAIAGIIGGESSINIQNVVPVQSLKKIPAPVKQSEMTVEMVLKLILRSSKNFPQSKKSLVNSIQSWAKQKKLKVSNADKLINDLMSQKKLVLNEKGKLGIA